MDHDGAKAAGGIAGRFAIGSPSGSPAGVPPAMSPPLPGTPDDGAAPADPKQELAFRLRRLQNWFFLGLMYAFFYMSRYNFSAVQAAVAEQFGWSYSDYGSIISAGLLTYGCAVFFNGPLADRVGGKRAILIGAAGAAVFNVLFGLGHLVLLRPATMVGGQVVIPAQLANGMSASTVIAMFAVIWACNFYFQSFGALSIVKINAAWFHISERGQFAGIFGIMIQGGRTLAFTLLPLTLKFFPWQYAFFIPAAVLVVMWFVCLSKVENTPASAGLRGARHRRREPRRAERRRDHRVRRAQGVRPPRPVDHRAGVDVHRHGASLGGPLVCALHRGDVRRPGQEPVDLCPLRVRLGGDADCGDPRRAVRGQCLGPAVRLAPRPGDLPGVHRSGAVPDHAARLHPQLLGRLPGAGLHLVFRAERPLPGRRGGVDGLRRAQGGGDGGGLFDGAQYLAGSLVGMGMGRLLDHYRQAGHPGAEFAAWPILPLVFAIVGALIISRLWHALPGRSARSPLATASRPSYSLRSTLAPGEQP